MYIHTDINEGPFVEGGRYTWVGGYMLRRWVISPRRGVDRLSGELWPGNHSHHNLFTVQPMDEDEGREERWECVCERRWGRASENPGKEKMAVLNKMFGVGITENEKWLLSIHCSLSPSLYPASK